MPIDVRAEMIINKPREDVAAFATDPNNDTSWISGIKEARMLTEPPLAQGSQVERVASFMGKRIHYVLEVVELAPQSLMAMRSVKGPFPMEVSYQFEDAGEATVARIHVKGEASGFFKIASPILAQGVKRNITKDLKMLKHRLEAQAIGG